MFSLCQKIQVNFEGHFNISPRAVLEQYLNQCFQ